MKKIVIIYVIIILISIGKVQAQDITIKEAEYTDQYKQYLLLTDEEKESVLEPRKYQITGSSVGTNENLLANSNISLKNLIATLKASSSIEKNYFSLKDLIEKNLKIRDQMDTPFCWTYASLSSLETNLAMKNYNNGLEEKIYNYSERHMAYVMRQNFKEGQINKYGRDTAMDVGGNMNDAISYLTNGMGAINEEDMPFENNTEAIDISEIENKEVQTTLNDTVTFNSITFDVNEADENIIEQRNLLMKQIKEHLINYGSIYASIYASDGINNDTGAIYYEKTDDEKFTDHAVSIVGWDDEYSIDNFDVKPQNKGAWIVRNSWGRGSFTLDFEFVKFNVLYSLNDEFKDKIDKIKIEGLTREEFLNKYDEEYNNITEKYGKSLTDEDYQKYADEWGYQIDFEKRIIYATDEDEVIENSFDDMKSDVLSFVSDEYNNAINNIKINGLDEETFSTRLQEEQDKITDSYDVTDDMYKKYAEENECEIDLEDRVIYKNNMGDGGFYYVSYDDYWIYSNLVGIVDADDYKTYDNLYQLDEQGAEECYKVSLNNKNEFETEDVVDEIYLANVFERTTSDKEYLTSVGVYTATEGNYEVYINPDGADKTLSKLQKAELTCGNSINLAEGYHNIKLANAYELIGDKFTIIIKESTKDTNQDAHDVLSFYADSDGGNKGESFITTANYLDDDEWIDVNDFEAEDDDENGYFDSSNFCIKGLTVNEYDGEIANNEKEKTDKATNFENATAKLINLSVENNQIDLNIEVNGIEINDLADKYIHYFYISSNSNETEIEQSKWSKVQSFEKQSDGTYTIKINITDKSKLQYIENNENSYIYIKEIAVKGDKETQYISQGIELKIDTSKLSTLVDGEKYTVKYEQNENNITMPTILPNAGLKNFIFILVILGIIALFSYIKYRKYNNIKL